jgi:hypothetical protein
MPWGVYGLFFGNHFNGVFGLATHHAEKHQNKTKGLRKKDIGLFVKRLYFFLSVDLQKVFDMDFPQKVLVVFLNSPSYETPKNAQTKNEVSIGRCLKKHDTKTTSLSSYFFLSPLGRMYKNPKRRITPNKVALPARTSGKGL